MALLSFLQIKIAIKGMYIHEKNTNNRTCLA
jgi:hypothetical protein